MAKYFMCIISFNPHNGTTKFVPLVYTFFQMKKLKQEFAESGFDPKAFASQGGVICPFCALGKTLT